jgi:hypothetical protein
MGDSMPEMTPEEHQQQGDLANARIQDFKRQIAERWR